LTADILTHEPDMSNIKSIEHLTPQFVELWWRCKDDAPRFEHTFTEREQAKREEMLSDFINTLSGNMKEPMHTEVQRRAMQQQITALGMVFAKAALGFTDVQLAAVQSCGIVEAACAFMQQARRFDASLSSNDIYQAARNVTTMNLLQLGMGLPVKTTPAVFAYSMLYPYSDNYLDDPSISAAGKRAFNERFRLRLLGEPFTQKTLMSRRSLHL
jgi:hypothetical protein